eukprot:4225443-Pleurochrysis_carterae.AAC.3
MVVAVLGYCGIPMRPYNGGRAAVYMCVAGIRTHGPHGPKSIGMPCVWPQAPFVKPTRGTNDEGCRAGSACLWAAFSRASRAVCLICACCCMYVFIASTLSRKASVNASRRACESNTA